MPSLTSASVTRSSICNQIRSLFSSVQMARMAGREYLLIMARGYDVGRPESRVECEVPPARRKHPPSDHHPPPTPKMGLEERSPSPRPSPPGEGEARTVPGILTPFGVELLQGTRVGD